MFQDRKFIRRLVNLINVYKFTKETLARKSSFDRFILTASLIICCFLISIYISLYFYLLFNNSIIIIYYISFFYYYFIIIYYIMPINSHLIIKNLLALFLGLKRILIKKSKL